MTRPDELLGAFHLLANLHMEDPALSLVNAVTWLCPEAISSVTEDEIMDLYDQDNLLLAMLVFMQHQPDVYAVGRAEIMSRDLKTTIDYNTVCNYLTDTVNKKLVVKMEYLGDVVYGPPAYGMGYDDSDDWWNEHQELEPIAAKIGLRNPSDAQRSGRAVSALTKSLAALSDRELLDFPDEELTLENLHPHEALRFLLEWLNNNTGNTVADFDQESLQELGIEPMNWSQKNVDFVNEMNREAQAVVKAAEAGESLLITNKEWREALLDNYRCVERKLKNGHTIKPTDCRWPVERRIGTDGHGAVDQHPTEDHAESL